METSIKPDNLADRRRALPAVGRLMTEPRILELIGLYGRDTVRVQARHELDHLRTSMQAAESTDPPGVHAVVERIESGLESRLGHPLARVINATGIFVHTNLGRAPLPGEIAAGLPALLDAYCDIEMDLGTGKRGQRGRRVNELLKALTGADAALVVNNNAAALMLALATLATDREVIVSRGELVEIGGSFRIPDIMETSGARLVEVGTTTRTRAADYERAIGPDTGLLLKVHPSNYRITGFTEEVDGRTLAEIGQRHDVPVLIDEGSGLLAPSARPQLADHPSHRALISDGCDLVCGSGDKLLGGPQAGILVGKETWVARCRKHPLYRVLRPNRFVLTCLDHVLVRHLRGLPMPMDRLWPDPTIHRERLERIARTLIASGAGTVEIVEANAYLGGGSAPETPVPGTALSLEGGDAFLERLRITPPAVVGYLRDSRAILDLRTVSESDETAFIDAVVAAANHGAA